MSLITLATPQVFDGSTASGNWLGALLGLNGRYTVEAATADRVTLVVTGPTMTGFRIVVLPVDHFVVPADSPALFTGAIGQITLLDADGGTYGIVEELPASATLATLGSGLTVATTFTEVEGSSGADTITGVPFGTFIYGEGGNDILKAAPDNGDDLIDGGPGDDTVDGRGGDDFILTGEGADLIDGGAGYDGLAISAATLVEVWFDQAAPAGGIRADNIEEAYAGDGGSRLHGGDRAQYFFGGLGRDVLEGAGGNDILYGDAGDDTLQGGAGADSLGGGPGADLLDGGAGVDFADYADATGAVVVDLRITSAQQTGFGLDTLLNIEMLNGSPGGDTMIGDAADNTIYSEQGNDLVDGQAGDDFLSGYFGNDTINGGDGSDTIQDTTGVNYLRGDAGNDKITGGAGFDDANGNMGDDTIAGGAGDDYSVGGKDNDLLFGDGGGDIVWGNLGNDTCEGGDGNDQVRGGQGDDAVNGGTGSDFVSGDRGNDTITGGAGADNFHGSQDAGIDRVLDFSVAEGDRVMLDPGTTFTTSQVGADTVLDMGGGNQMILVGVSMASLTAGSIFLG